MLEVGKGTYCCLCRLTTPCAGFVGYVGCSGDVLSRAHQHRPDSCICFLHECEQPLWGMPVSCNEVPMNPEIVDHGEIKGTSELLSCPSLCPCYPKAQLSAAGHLGCLCSGSMLGSAVWAGLAAPAIFSLAPQYFLSSSFLADSAPFLQGCLQMLPA